MWPAEPATAPLLINSSSVAVVGKAAVHFSKRQLRSELSRLCPVVLPACSLSTVQHCTFYWCKCFPASPAAQAASETIIPHLDVGWLPPIDAAQLDLDLGLEPAESVPFSTS